MSLFKSMFTKHSAVFNSFCIWLFLSFFSLVKAQVPPPPCPCDPLDPDYAACEAANPGCTDQIPIDANIWIVLILGAGYFFYIMYRKEKRSKAIASGN